MTTRTTIRRTFTAELVYGDAGAGNRYATIQQQTPNGITVAAPAASNPHGDPVDPYVTLPWDLGPVDASAQSHTIDVGPLTQGVPS